MGQGSPLGDLMRILVVGGYGFLGGRLAAHLATVGHQVVIGTRNLEQVPVWLPQAEVVQLHWNDPKALQKICDGVDVVIHAAGMNAHDCAAQPVAALEFNGVGTARLVEAASRAAVKRFLYFSTAHVYGSRLSGVIDEDTWPQNSHPYATSHLAGENSVLFARLEKKIQGTVLRLTNAFGAPIHRDANCWSLLINGLCRQVVEEGKMTLLSPGFQRRDFIEMSAVCCIIEEIINRRSEVEIPSTINVSLGVSQTVREIAQLIQQRCEAVLGFTPPLTWPKNANDSECLPLEFRSNGLKALNIAVQNNGNLQEIDELLRFCAISFQKTPLPRADYQP